MLNRAVFQVPDLGKIGAQIQQQKQVKQEAVASERKTNVDAGGIEKKFFGDDAAKLTPLGKKVAKAAYDAWREKSVNYSTTGSETDRQDMLYAQQQFNEIWGAEQAIFSNFKTIGDTYVNGAGKGFAEKEEDFKKNMEQFRTTDAPIEVKNGQVFVNGNPYRDFERYSTSPNLLNRPDINVVDPRSKFVDIESVAKNYVNTYSNTSGVRTEDPDKGVFYNSSEMLKKSLESLEVDLKDPAKLDGMILRHVFSNGGLDPNSMSQSEINETLTQYKNDPSRLAAAKESYVSDLKKEITRQMPASNPFKAPKIENERTEGGDLFRVEVARDDDGNFSSIKGFVYRMPDSPIEKQIDGIKYSIDAIKLNPDGSIRSVMAKKSKKSGDSFSFEESDAEEVTDANVIGVFTEQLRKNGTLAKLRELSAAEKKKALKGLYDKRK